MTAFFTICVLRRPRTSVRKSSRRSDQRIPPRAIGPPRRCTPSSRGEYTKISKAGPRLGHLVHARRVELEGEAQAAAAVRHALVVVGAERPVDELEVGAKDPVLVEARDRLEAAEDPLRDRVGRGAVRRRLAGRRTPDTGIALGTGRGARPRRVEARMEEAHEVADDHRVAVQRVLHIGLAEAEADLPQVLRIGAKESDLAPVEAGGEGKPVEAVVLRLAGPHPGEALPECATRRVEVGRGTRAPLPEPEVVKPHRLPVFAGRAEHARVLVFDPDPHVLEHGKRVREVHRPPEVKELEAEEPGIGTGRPEKVRRERAARRLTILRRGARRYRHRASPPDERLGDLDVPKGGVRTVPATVPRAEHPLVAAPE